MPSCPVHEVLEEDNRPLFSEEGLDLKVHQVGFIVTGIFCVIACCANGWLISKHLAFYTNKRQQRQIVRILFMVPVYALVSWASYFWWQQSLYFQLVRDCYEAFVLMSFFYLLLAYMGDSPAEQRQAFKRIKLEKWMWPLGRLRYRPSSGLHFVWLCKWLILQYVVLRPLCTLAACISNALGYYCVASWSPLFVHVWTTGIITISVTLALYIVLQFTVVLGEELATYRPMYKFFVVKGLVFVIFWQYVLLSILMYFDIIKQTKYWSAEEVMVGFEALLITFEMVLFAFAHVKAFSYLPYRAPGADAEERKLNQTNRWKAFCNVIDYRDVGRELGDGTVYMAQKVKGKAEPDRREDLEVAFGKARPEDEEGWKRQGSQFKGMTEAEKELERVKLLGETEDDCSSSLDRKGLLDPRRSSTDFDSPLLEGKEDEIRYPSQTAYDSLYSDPFDNSLVQTRSQSAARSNGQYSSLGLEEDFSEKSPVIPSADDDRQPHSRKEGVEPKRMPKKADRWWSSLRSKKEPIPVPSVSDAQLHDALWLGSVPSLPPSQAKPQHAKRPSIHTAPVKSAIQQRYPSNISRSLPKNIVLPSPLSPSRYPSPPTSLIPAHFGRQPSIGPSIRPPPSVRRVSLDGRYPQAEPKQTIPQATAPEMRQTRSAPLTYPTVNFASSSRSIKIIPSTSTQSRSTTTYSHSGTPLTDFGQWQPRPPNSARTKSKFLFEEC